MESREIRLQKLLSQAGISSRRKGEELITAGKVWVNGKPARELGTKVDPTRDKVTVDGRLVQAAPHVYYLMVKPKGYVTTVNDPEGRHTVMELLGDRGRGLFPVGRLDFHTDGVLLITNDGELGNALMHPSGGVAKTYHAKLRGEVSAASLAALCDGVVLDDGALTLPAEVNLVAATSRHTWLQITIRQGLNRQIHRMAEAIGHSILKLSRVAYGPLSSEGVRPGEYRELSREELTALRRSISGSGKQPEAPAPKAPPRMERRERPTRSATPPRAERQKRPTRSETPTRATKPKSPVKPSRPGRPGKSDDRARPQGKPRSRPGRS